MLKLTILAFAVMLTTFGVAAQMLPAFPPGAEAHETQLLTKLSSQSRAWIKQEAARKVATGDFSDASALSAAQNYVRGRNLADGMDADIGALAFLVLMGVAKSTRDDLKAIMDDAEQINHAKSKARETASKSRPTTAPSRLTPPESAMAIAKTPAMKSATDQPQLQPQLQARHQAMPRSKIQPRPMQKTEFDRLLNLNKKDLELLSDMSELNSLRMQMATDRLFEIMSTLSNIMKKTSDTQSDIIQKIK
jgi:hypothetical protein